MNGTKATHLARGIATLAIAMCTACLSLAAARAEGKKPAGLNNAAYAAALKAYVNDNGMVNYKGLKAHPQDLNAFLKSIARLARKDFEKLPTKQQIAFWINAYNACTLKAIISNYPLKSSFFRSFVYPSNSIRPIKGVWDTLKFKIMGRQVTLDDIEHNTLRKKFNEPRIHLALVCAAMGCPPLLNEPYEGKTLDSQLDGRARQFLKNPKKFRIDRAGRRVYISPIFEWFGEDFIKTYGTDKKFAGRSEAERAVLNFLSKYLKQKGQRYLAGSEYKVVYMDYDWSLNEQRHVPAKRKRLAD
ncbi:MAG: DUF547 domain-containing protein [Phycisphaerae bacterium]|nr:DUF547 domain-containing protein [Phycisphaerae bacterium]